jgi:uncharacterized repeat protein (TIGR01451 family)
MKIFRLVPLSIFILIVLTAFLPTGAALAQDETSPDSITLSTDYPTLDAIATGSFDFVVELSYIGQTDRVFDLNVTVPNGWSTTVTPQYDTKLISSIAMDKSATIPTQKNIEVKATPPSRPLADPGEYVIVLKVSSGDISAQINLTARITAKYTLNATPANTLFSTNVKAGKDNTYSITVTNTGTDAIDNINFSSSTPSGWEITFTPEKIDSLEALDSKTIDVNIKPPSNTVAGDYMITLSVSGTQASATDIDVRVTVTTPTIWGWVGLVIIAIVVVGLVIIFMRFGRR